MEITSRQNERIRHLKKLGQSAAYRRETGEFLLEGWKLYQEACQSGAAIREVLVSDRLPDTVPAGARVYRVPYDLIEAVSPMRSPQSILFSCAIPPQREAEPLRSAVILETVQDPGNLGTVLRTANAFGIPQVVLVGDCADPWSAKTARASMGAIFRQPLLRLPLEALRPRLAPDTRLYGAALGERSADIRRVDLQGACVAVGSEGRGLSQALLDLCDGLLIIPMCPGSESLNAAAAAAIVMWEMKGRLS